MTLKVKLDQNHLCWSERMEMHRMAETVVAGAHVDGRSRMRRWRRGRNRSRRMRKRRGRESHVCDTEATRCNMRHDDCCFMLHFAVRSRHVMAYASPEHRGLEVAVLPLVRVRRQRMRAQKITMIRTIVGRRELLCCGNEHRRALLVQKVYHCCQITSFNLCRLSRNQALIIMTIFQQIFD